MRLVPPLLLVLKVELAGRSTFPFLFFFFERKRLLLKDSSIFLPQLHISPPDLFRISVATFFFFLHSLPISPVLIPSLPMSASLSLPGGNS